MDESGKVLLIPETLLIRGTQPCPSHPLPEKPWERPVEGLDYGRRALKP